MQFIFSPDAAAGVNESTKQLTAALTRYRRVLWLVCGGSSIAAIATIMQAIPEELTNHLTVSLTDERYGDFDHPDSNWRQLREHGFDPKRAQQLPILQPSTSLEETVEHYNQLAHKALGEADFVVAHFGMGADGHIAGILPQSVAAHQETDLATGYQTIPFLRLTLTFPALKRIDTAFAFVFGDSKKQALLRLRDKELPLSEQPAQILRQLPAAFVYNDQLTDD